MISISQLICHSISRTNKSCWGGGNTPGPRCLSEAWPCMLGWQYQGKDVKVEKALLSCFCGKYACCFLASWLCHNFKSVALGSMNILCNWVCNHLLNHMESLSVPLGLSPDGSQSWWFWSRVGVLRAESGKHLHEKPNWNLFIFN